MPGMGGRIIIIGCMPGYGATNGMPPCGGYGTGNCGRGSGSTEAGACGCGAAVLAAAGAGAAAVDIWANFSVCFTTGSAHAYTRHMSTSVT